MSKKTEGKTPKKEKTVSIKDMKYEDRAKKVHAILVEAFKKYDVDLRTRMVFNELTGITATFVYVDVRKKDTTSKELADLEKAATEKAAKSKEG